MGGLQLIRAAWATRSPALDASQQLKGEVDFVPAAALPGHLDLLGIKLADANCKKCSLSVTG